jgi:hypothetical protein
MCGMPWDVRRMVAWRPESGSAAMAEAVSRPLVVTITVSNAPIARFIQLVVTIPPLLVFEDLLKAFAMN